MGEVKPLREFGPTFLKVRYYDGKSFERIGSEPRRKVRLNGHPAGLADLRYLGRYENRVNVEIDGFWPELRNLAIRHLRADSCKKAEGEIGHPPSPLETFKVFHEVARLGGGKRARGSDPAADPVVGHFENRIVSDQASMKRELEKGREYAALIAIGLHGGPADRKKRQQPRYRQAGDGLIRELVLKPFQIPSNSAKLRARNVVLLEFVLLCGDIFGNGVGQELLAFRSTVIR